MNSLMCDCNPVTAVEAPVDFTPEELSDLVAAADASLLPPLGGVSLRFEKLLHVIIFSHRGTNLLS